MTRLSVTPLESRLTPAVDPSAPFGTGVAFGTAYGPLLGPGTADVVYYAPDPGEGARVMVVDESGAPGDPVYVLADVPGTDGPVKEQPGLGAVVANFFAGDPNVLSGASVTIQTVPTGYAILDVTGGPGDGPLVYQFQFSAATQTFGLVHTIVVGDPSLRTGLTLGNGDVNPPVGQLVNQDLIVSADAGGGPILQGYDASGRLLASILIGPADDRSGQYQPEPAGEVFTPDGQWVVTVENPDQNGTGIDAHEWTWGGVQVT